ncbi:unnamed protein product [Arctia plantaginis]|uniref:non-specific serine/threonine protein kinase n=1 Tax=Arctia plantaginis TaxID=874455 RepID=A0A8S0Z997_ARCPL|nr:unnamed protein product [Arctia plantaginis]
MCEDLKHLKILKQGAEARLYVCNYLGRPTLIKERFTKKYRHPDLDTVITKDRIKNEARSIVRCKTANIRTPTLYLVDFDRRRIYMEYFENSKTVKDFIKNLSNVENSCIIEQIKILAKLIGESIRKLHENNIIHGDLTTSNMLLVPKNENEEINWLEVDKLDLVMIDFGLSFIDSSTEDKAVDLYVLERAVESTDVPHLEVFHDILEAYQNFSENNTKELINKYREVSARGRKRTMVG